MTRLRISVIARWAATPSTCDRPNPVADCTTAAANPMPASSNSSSIRPSGTTSSMT